MTRFPNRISMFVQRLAFGQAVILPMVMILTGYSEIVLWITGYSWVVGFLAAVWHRKVVEG